MFVFIVRRLLTGLVLVVAISVIAFALLYAGGGNIARGLLGQEATAAAVAAKAHDLGLDRPLVTQFSDWVGHAITGDLGQSWFTGQPVGAALLSRLAVTLADGRRLTAAIDTPVGRPDFNAVAAFARKLAPEMDADVAAVDRFVAQVAGLESAPSLDALISALSAL